MQATATLNNLDYIVLGIILLSGLFALMRGFIREVFSLIAWLGAYAVAANYFPLAEPWVHRYIKNPTTVGEVAAVIVFCLAFIALSIAGSIIARFVRGQALTSIDRSLGFVFGLVRGVLIVCLIYLLAGTILWPDLDKIPAPINDLQAQEIPPTDSARAPAPKEKDTIPPAPEWLLTARTRPLLAYGAVQLKAFIPEKEFERKSQQYLEQSTLAQHIIESKGSNEVVPASPPEPARTSQPTGYDSQTRIMIAPTSNTKVNP